MACTQPSSWMRRHRAAMTSRRAKPSTCSRFWKARIWGHSSYWPGSTLHSTSPASRRITIYFQARGLGLRLDAAQALRDATDTPTSGNTRAGDNRLQFSVSVDF
jgi:hypothetical protein